MTTECVTAAASIIQRMDESVDPCQDFYSFSCGGFIDNEPIPQEASGVSTMSKMQVCLVYLTTPALTVLKFFIRNLIVNFISVYLTIFVFMYNTG